MAAFLLAGANTVKAEDIWTNGQNGGSIVLTKEMLKNAQKGTKLLFYIGQKNDNYWQIDFKINDSFDPDFRDFPGAKWGNTWALQTRNDLISDNCLEIVFGNNTADRINSHGSITVNLTNIEVKKISLVNEVAVKKKITYKVDDTVFATQEVEVGDEIPLLTSFPTKDGFVFTTWAGLPSTMPNEDITVTATFRTGVEEAAWSEGNYTLDWDFTNKGISIDADLFNNAIGDIYVRVYGTGGTWFVQLGYVEGGQGQKINVDGNNEGTISIYSSDEKKATMAYGYVEYKIDANSLAKFKEFGAKVGGNDFVASKVTVIANSFSGSTIPSTKTDVTLTYSAETASATTASIGQTLANAPTLTVSPEGLEGITYSSSKESVATVAADGTVTIEGAGTTTITATFAETDTHKGASAYYTLTVSKQNVTLAFSSETASAKMEQPFTAPILTVTPEGLEGITYSSSNTGIATVANDGTVTLVAAGNTTITASFAENAIYNAASASYSLTIAEADVPTFTVTVAEIANGQISASPATDVTEGTTVTITATPAEGYKLSTVTVTAGETNVDVSGTGNTRTFTMPAQDVSISATFTKIPMVKAEITSSTGFATFCSNQPLDFTGITTLEAYYAKTVEDGNVYLLKVYGIVPAFTGLVIKGTTTYIPVAESDGETIEGNLLIGVTADKEVNSANFYVLAEKNNAAVFVQTGVNKATVAANHAYLEVSAAQARTRTIGIGGEGTTGIEYRFVDDNEQGVEVIYNLNGQRVKNPRKGLYIINGKKVLVK